MHTFASVTRSTSVAAPPSAVFDLIRDEGKLPEWAPDFVAQGLPFRIRSSAEAGTVDIVVSEAPPAGAFARVLANGDGSELVLTVILPFPADEPTLAAQAATAETELTTIRALCAG